jgi:thiosulfate dehydrogenase [quinone] large subunit
MTNLSSLRTAPSRTIAERRASSVERRAPTTNPTPPAVSAMDTRPARIGLGVLRMATGFMFLWTFFDKTFGPGYSTVMARAWINGGSPSQGYLTSAEISGPLKPLFAAIASPASDILFRLGMLTIGLAVMVGIGLRVSAVVGTFLLVPIYLSQWSFDKNTASTNPFVDYHTIYALVLIVLALVCSGDTWGFGLDWKRLPFVQRRRGLI